jgi:predicted nucleic acid-binding protein
MRILNMPEAVSDSSTLIHLAGIERLDVLKELYQEIFIPPAVWKEVVEEGLSRPGAAEVKEAINAGWIKVKAPTNDSVVRLLERELHK